MLNPIHPPPVTWYMTFGVLVWIIPFYVELILLLHLASVYPPRRLHWVRTICIFGPLALFKLGQLVNISITFTNMTNIQRHNPGLGPLSNSQLAWQKVTGYKFEWILQAVDNR